MCILAALAIMAPCKVEAADVEGLKETEEVEIKYVPIGTYSILNNELSIIDYKITNTEQIDLMNDHLFSDCDKVQKVTSTVGEQDFSGIRDNPYLSYLIENNFLSRRVCLNNFTGTHSETLISSTDNKSGKASGLVTGEGFMSKSDLYMALYKMCYGIELSNPIAFSYPIEPSVPTQSDACKIAENVYAYYPNGGIAYYQSPNVYELYLTRLLEKGLISMNELALRGLDLANTENNFELVYNDIQKQGCGSGIPRWYNYTQRSSWKDLLNTNSSSLYDLKVPSAEGSDKQFSLYRKYLGNSIEVRNYSNSEGYLSENYVVVKGNSTDVGYFAKEKLTISEALKIIEKMVRATEKEMTKIEADLINYKYGVTILDSMTDEEKDTVSFLIAKGILNFDEKDTNSDKELYTDLSADFTWGDAWKLLYRVANKEARYDFSKLQLTDAESFWQKKGYAENEISVYASDAVPYVDVISATKVKEEPSGALTVLEDQDSPDDLEMLYHEEEDNSDDSQENLITKIQGVLDKWFTTELYATNNNTTVSAVSNACYEVKIILANQYNGVDVTYKYGEETLNANSVNSIDDLVNFDNTSYPGYTLYTFKINASTRNRAIALLHTRLKMPDIDAPLGTMMGVTTMTNSKTGKTTTLISKDAIAENLPEIKVINNNTLMNVETGVMVTMLPNQENLGGRSIAFCGNKVIICDDMIVTDNSSQIYYNLETICSILPNAVLKKINGATSVVRTGITQESLYQIVDSDSNVIENNYVANFTNFEDSKGNLENFYNLDSAARSKNCLERTWDLKAEDKSGKVQNIKLTMIVEWNYCVPSQGAAGSSILLAEDYSEDFTLEDVNTFLNTRPTSEQLAFYWDRNVGMSNALVQMMYGDEKKTEYVTCGYLVPSVYILATGGAGRDANQGNDKQAVFVSKTSLSDTQLNAFFRKLNLSTKYINTYLGGSMDNWWNSFYKNFSCDEYKDDYSKCTGANCSNYFVHELMSAENCFKVYSPSIISEQKNGNANMFYAFGAKEDADGSYTNTRFILTEGNTVYRSVNKDTKCETIQCSGTDTTGILKMDTKSDNLMILPSKLDNVTVEGSGVTLKYISTETINNVSAYRFVLSDTGNNQDVTKTFTCHFTGKTKKDLDTLANYVNKDNQTPSDYAKYVANKLDSLAITPPSNTYYLWDDLYYSKLNGIEYHATWEKYKSNRIVGKVLKTDKLQNGKFGTKTSLDVSRFSEINTQDKIHVSVPVFFSTNGCYIMQEGQTLKLKKGTGLGALNSSIYFVGLNGIVRDKLLVKDGNAVPVNSLEAGNYVFINNKKFSVTKKGYLQSTLQIAQPDVATAIAKQYVATKSPTSKGVSSAILQTFNGYGIHAGGRIYSFATFVTDVKLGGLDKSAKKTGGILNRQIYKKNKKVYCYTTKGAVEITKDTITECDPTAFLYSMKVSDKLLCRPISSSGNVYEVIQVTDAYSDAGMGDLPFILKDALDMEESKTELSFSDTGFRVTAFTKELKTEFLNNYQELLEGDVWSLCRLFGIYVLGYLMVITWVITFMLKLPIAQTVLLAIAQKDRGSHGIDLVKIVSLGIYSVSDNPSISKLLIMDILFTIIMFFLLNGFG